MKKIFRAICLCMAVLLPATILAQNPDVEKMVANWERAKAYTKEYLDAMPEEGYGFKPTPEIRSFAEQMLHLAEANYGLSSMATGKPSPYKWGELEKSYKSKEQTIKDVMASYDFVITGIREMKPETFSGEMEMMGKKFSKLEGLEKTFEHQTHHRGQTTIYLRLKGVQPPQEKLL